MEQQLAAGLGEGQIAEFVEDDEVHAREIVGHATLPAGACLSLELVDEIDDVEETPPCAGTDASAGDRDGEMSLAGPRAADEDDIALMGDEVAAGQVADESTRTALQNAISNANNVAGQSTPAQSDVNNAKSQLQKAASDVNASISAKQQADAEAQRKQQEQQNAANQNQNQNQNQNSTNSGQSSQNQNAQCDDSADGTCQTGNGND